MHRTLRDILDTKSRRIVTITPDRTLREAAAKLCEHRIGALLVLDGGGRLAGIISERDLLIRIADSSNFDHVKVGNAMTRNVVVGLEDDPIDYTMNVMTRVRVRHLPVMRGHELVGVVSIGDVVNMLRVEEEQEIRYLTDYIKGTY